MPRAGIIYNDNKPTAHRTALDLEQLLMGQGYEVLLTTGVRGLLGCVQISHDTCVQKIADLVPPSFDGEVEFAIVLGGDGTVLSACRQLAPLKIPMLAINTGHMGFLTETYLNHLEPALEALLQGEYSIEDRSMMRVQVGHQQQMVWEALSLNEMVLHKEPLTGMCHFEVRIGDHALIDIAADGVIVSTPTGSTAYALAAGGPVITPGVSVLQLIPICPHSLASRALVFADSEPLEIFPANHERLVMVVDGNAGCYIGPEHKVRISRSPFAARFIRLKSAEFFRILREKLGWGLPHIAKPTSVELP
ncbi:NAD(+) kinase [Lyngbya confervoides]|uniref:NAD kinase n=1 Tax=Lyngbya confervoides BDU141951 TaxID=1574623 RepID=A0ABD4T989_9CYAN|nr:NAD(+) kinase [Lyngbya confervoides]MCM1985191.1 NAD(+) kinase [Lyngbya confervoides BDU141951]